ncbi:MAG TPA: LysE family translocator [Vineibacter sp.]|nr:LysE family translocator [Vineibacter sp.]
MVDSGSGILVFAAALFVTATPGPNSFYVPARTLAGGRNEGLASSLGIAVGGMVHVIAGAIGVSAVIMASVEAFTVLKLAGAAFLAWLGIRMIREAGVERPATSLGAGGLRQAFRDGIVMEALNPKTAAFFLAFIPGFVDPAGNVPLQYVIFGMLTVIASGIIDIVVTLTASTARGQLARRPALMRRVHQGCGLLVILLGAALAFVNRPV